MWDPNEPATRELVLRVAEARHRDVGRGLARIASEGFERLGIAPGQTIEILGHRRTVARAFPIFGSEHRPEIIQIDGLIRENARVGLDDVVRVRPIPSAQAMRVTLQPVSGSISAEASRYLPKWLEGVPVLAGDTVRIWLPGARAQDYVVLETEPDGPVIIQLATACEIAPTPVSEGPPRLTYEDIGGLKREIAQLRELVELPLKHPAIFESVGIRRPRGVLLCGPTGIGKSLLARVVAASCHAHFLHTTGPDLISRYHEQAGFSLRNLFRQAREHQPAVIFIDEMDAIASTEILAHGALERRILAELVALMDELPREEQVVVIGSSTQPHALDASLRRHGRFERTIVVGIPSYRDRMEILEIHSRGLPLAEDVDFQHLAELTRGFVGADLLALCQEAALLALREVLPTPDVAEPPCWDAVARARIRMTHFLDALKTITPLTLHPSCAELIEVRWEDVGGLHEVRERLTEAVLLPLGAPALFARVRARPPRGILLHGPAGTGKTLLVRALAGETKLRLFSARGLEMLAFGPDRSATVARDLFQQAQRHAPAIVFLDDLDALGVARQREALAGAAERVLAEVIAEMDRLEYRRGVIVLGAAQDLQHVPRELLAPGRFELRLDVPIPDVPTLREILQIHLRHRPLAEDVNLDLLAQLAQGLTGADLEAACQQAAWMALRDFVQHPDAARPASPIITQEHLAAAIEAACERKLREE